MMPKKPVKIILKFSNDSTTKDKPKKGKGKDKPKKSGPSGSSDRESNGPRKLKP